jgi:cysteine desulfurase/selenocysteine lyase
MTEDDFNAKTFRADFPILDQRIHGHPLVYLDNAATTQKPRAVIDALVRYYERDNSNVHRGIHELSNRATEAYEGARARVAKFIGAEFPEEIVYTRGTTEAINLVAHSWGSKFLKPGDKILLTEMEHHSNIVPWQLIAARVGAKLSYVPVTGDEGELDLGRLDELLADGVKIFAFTHISNSLGTVNPAAELCARARHHGVVTLVDAAQSAGHMPIDVLEMGCDFLAFSGHKMCGPTGFGGLYGRRKLLEQMVPYQGGGDMISRVDFFESAWNSVPHKFEAGTPDISGAIGLAAALDYLDRIGRDRIFHYDHTLAQRAYDALADAGGVRLFGPKRGRAGVVSFLVNGVHAHDVVTVADQYGVALRGGHHCTQPLMRKLGVESTARASLYFYNTPEEVDRLIEVLGLIRKFFGT